MVVEGSVGAPLLEVPFEPGLCCLVQGQETALPEFGTPDHQTIGSDVVKAQPDRFRHSQSRAGQQGEQRAVGRWMERSIPRLRSCLDELSDLFGGQNVGGYA